MIFIKNETEYPRYIGDIQNQNPLWSIGDPLPEGWDIVVETTAPSVFAMNQIVTEDFPKMIDGVWTQSWSIVQLSAYDIEQRNAKDSGILDIDNVLLNKYRHL